MTPYPLPVLLFSLFPSAEVENFCFFFDSCIFSIRFRVFSFTSGFFLRPFAPMVVIVLLLLLLLLLLGVTTRDATRDGCVFGGVCVLVCRVLCPFFFVFFVFLSCVTMTEREEERDLSAFSLSRGDRRQKKRRKSRKKKSCWLCEKGKKIQIDHSSSFF